MKSVSAPANNQGETPRQPRTDSPIDVPTIEGSLPTLRALSQVNGLVLNGGCVGNGGTQSTAELCTEIEQRLKTLTTFVDDAVKRTLAHVQDLRNRALVDSLTQILNVRAFHEGLVPLSNTTLQTDQRFAILLVDIDNFKSHNSPAGHLNHAAGDVILRAVCDAFRRCIRSSDIAFPFRKGGDEFLIALLNADIEAARSRAEEISHQIAMLKPLLVSEPLGPVTASFGVAAAPEHGSSVGELLTAAATALAIAKIRQNGSVVVASLDDTNFKRTNGNQ